MENNLKVTRARLIKVASESPQNQAVIEQLFPELYVNYITITPKRQNELIKVLRDGLFAGHAFALSSEFKWDIVVDENNVVCLLPERHPELKYKNEPISEETTDV